MTAILEKAFARAARLPDELQEQLAAQLLADMAAEKKWDRTLARSQSLLEKLARAARGAKREGRVQRKGFDEL